MRRIPEIDGPGLDLVDAAVKLLAEDGAASLTTRKVAEAAGLSTMAVYSRFGDMATLLDAVYAYGFTSLEAEMRGDGSDPDPMAELLRLGQAYRRFALSNPALFALLFERPLPGFDPSPEIRTAALDATFGILQAAVEVAQEDGSVGPGDPRWLAYLIWVGVHGTVSLEATHVARSVNEWILAGDADGARAVATIVETVCAGTRSNRR